MRAYYIRLLLVSLMILSGCQNLAADAKQAKGGENHAPAIEKPLAPGSRVTAMLRVQNAPSDVRAMGYEIWFNPAALKFEKFERQGEMKNRFAMLGGNVVKPGKLRMGGIEPQTGTPLESGTTGDLFVLQFSVIGQGSPDFRFMNLKDDIRDWPSKVSSCGQDADFSGLLLCVK